MDDGELRLVESGLDARCYDLAQSVGYLADGCGGHFVDFGAGEDGAGGEVVDEGPFDYGERAEDGVVEEFVDDVDGDAGLVGPVVHHGGDDLTACQCRLRADGEESVFVAFDAGEHVGEGFGSDVADGGHEGVCRWYHCVFYSEFLGLFFDRRDDRLDLFVAGFFADELHEVTALRCIRCSCQLVHTHTHTHTHTEREKLTISCIFKVRNILLLSFRDQILIRIRQGTTNTLRKTQPDLFIKSPSDERHLRVHI